MSNPAWTIRKPSVGRYRPDVLGLEDRPPASLRPGQVRVRTLLLSLDPSNLMWLKLQPGWMEDVKVGDVMKGPSLAVVEESADPGFSPGDLVSGPIDWSVRSNVAAAVLKRHDPADGRPLTSRLTIFSHVGQAAMIGMRWVGKVRKGEVVLVSGAAGATGSLACQIALAEGCRVIGIAGGPEKCAFLTREIGVDHAIDYKANDVAEALARLCPQGPGMMFDNVGGALLDSLLPHLGIHARIAICGQMSQYDSATPADGYRYANLFYLFMRRMTMQGFVVPDFNDEMDRVDMALDDLFQRRFITDRPHVLEGIEHAAVGLEMLVTGANHGKLLVGVSAHK